MSVTRLRVLREKRGITQAAAAREFGVSLATYGPVERGDMRPSARLRSILEERLGFPTEQLLAPIRPFAPRRRRDGEEVAS